MSYLLDTHALLWALTEPEKLGKRARGIFESDKNDIYVSAASVWEMAIKIGLGKLDFPLEALGPAMSDARLLELPIGVTHAARVITLPPLHRDPFDRMLIAQALAEKLTLVSRDEALAAYGARTIWA